MEELCFVLGVLALLVVVITLVGHGFWKLAALILRFLSGGRRAPAAGAACPRCGNALAGEEPCRFCGWSAQVPLIASVDEQAIAARIVQDLFARGRINHDTCNSLLLALGRESKSTGTAEVPLAARGAPAASAVAEAKVVLHQQVILEPPPLPLPPGLGMAQTAPADIPVARRAEPLVVPEPVPLQPPQLPPPPPAPRRSWSELFAAFMEESNIRWGELVGGLLVIGCSIALVVTFWSEIALRPWLQFFVFTAVTASVFGVGLYTEHRWKLPTTSRGLLLIATLLVPLNFLAIVAQAAAPRALPAIAGELVVFALFAALVWLAGRVLIPLRPLALAAGVVGTSTAQMLVNRIATGPEAALGGTAVLLLAATAVVIYGLSAGWLLAAYRRSAELAREDAAAVFTLLGTSTAAVLLPIGLLASRTGDWGWALRQMSPALGCGGLPALACGLMLWRRLRSEELTSARVAGTSTAILGATVLIGGIALAWPRPAMMLPMALIDFAVLTAVALAMNIPAAHVLAIPCLVLAYALGVHLLLPASHPGHIQWTEDSAHLTSALLASRMGLGRMVLVAVFWIMAEGWNRFRRPLDARFYAVGGGILAAISIILTSSHGLGRADDHGATFVYAGYAVAAFCLAWRLGQPVITWLGAALLALAAVQGMVFRFPIPGDWILRSITAALTYGTLLLGISCLAKRSAPAKSVLGRPMALAGQAASILAAAMLLVLVLAPDPAHPVGTLALQTLWLSATWLLAIVAAKRLGWVNAFQAALAVGVMLAAYAHLQDQPWFAALSHPLADPRTLHIEGAALALLGLAWIFFRLIMRPFVRQREMGKLIDAAGWTLDRLLAPVLVAAATALAVIAVAPGIAGEMAQNRETASEALHAHAYGPTAWWLWGSVAALTVVGLWDQGARWAVLALPILLAAACTLLAAQWEGVSASASAARWLLAGLLVLGSALIWARGQVTQWAQRIGWTVPHDSRPDLAAEARMLLLLLTLFPILSLTIYPAVEALRGAAVVGPAAGSYFARLGNATGYLVPLAAAIATMVGHALRERSAPFALSAGLILNLAVSLGYALSIVTAGSTVGSAEIARLLQLNGIAAGLFSLGWLLVLHLTQGREAPPLAAQEWPLVVQVSLALAFLAALLVPAEVALVGDPHAGLALVPEAGHVLHWVAWALAGAAALWLAWRWTGAMAMSAVGITLVAAGSLGAFTAARTGDQWLAYHLLIGARGCAAAIMLGLGWALMQRRYGEDRVGADAWLGGTRWRQGVTAWATALMLMTVILAWRAHWDDPTRPWWAVGGLAGAGLLGVGLALWTLRSGWFYATGFLFNVATTLWWLDQGRPISPAMIAGLLQVNVIALCAAGLAFLALELVVLRPARAEAVHIGWRAFHVLAGVLSTGAVVLLTTLGFLHQLAVQAPMGNPYLAAGSIVAAVALLAGSLWDRDARHALGGLYLTGLSAGTSVLAQVGAASDEKLLWLLTMVLAGYSLAVGMLFTQRVPLARWAERAGMPLREGWPAASPGWIAHATLLVSLAVIALGCAGISSLDNLLHRLLAAAAVIAMAGSIGLLGTDQPASRLKHCALVLGAIGTVLWAWAWLDPGRPSLLLDRMALTMAALAVVSVLYGVGLVKLLRNAPEWTEVAEQLAPLLAGATTAALMGVLAMEALLFDAQLAEQAGRAVPMALWAVLLVAATLLGLTATAVVCAVVPGRDPLDLPERQRTAYVYGAEFLLVLLFVHTKLCYPDLLKIAIWTRFWPIIVLLLAFLGVGLSELFRRQGRMVLAEPLQNTGALFPVLPVLAYWLLTDFWTHEQHIGYETVLFTAGLVYGLLAVLRRSFWFGLMAAMAGNGALWYLLHRTESLGFFQHPQLWLIPAALSVLAAAYLNRERLSAEQIQTVRYVCLMVIYVSSTADIWINGVREAPWLPAVLGALAIAGVGAGILLRVQSYLFLGTLFLLVSISTMIRYATLRVHSNWPWLVAGIVVGSAIVLIFALFEKKRAEMLALVDSLKEWQG